MPLGTNYGGDGRTTFGLPNLQGRTPVGVGNGAGLSPVRQGQMRGVEMVTANLSTMAAHTHTATFTSTGGTVIHAASKAKADAISPTNGAYLGEVNAGRGVAAHKIYTNVLTDSVSLGGLSVEAAGDVAVAPAGAQQSVANIPPQLGVRYCIVTDGLFPPRN